MSARPDSADGTPTRTRVIRPRRRTPVRAGQRRRHQLRGGGAIRQARLAVRGPGVHRRAALAGGADRHAGRSGDATARAAGATGRARHDRGRRRSAGGTVTAMADEPTKQDDAVEAACGPRSCAASRHRLHRVGRSDLRVGSGEDRDAVRNSARLSRTGRGNPRRPQRRGAVRSATARRPRKARGDPRLDAPAGQALNRCVR